MNHKKKFAEHRDILEQVGKNIKLARKRRKIAIKQVAQQANINRTTLYYIEKGNPSVSIGAYLSVLKVFDLHHDILKLAADDEHGRELQDQDLLSKR